MGGSQRSAADAGSRAGLDKVSAPSADRSRGLPMSDARAAAQDIIRTLRVAGHEAYFAGGCVRDELLGSAPADYDVATSAHPAEVRALFRSVSEVGASFGHVARQTSVMAAASAAFFR